jgi:hypothetical protein
MSGSVLRCSWFALALAGAGCVGEAEEVGTAEEAALTANALTANALTANALTANALTANALTANALTANALTANALTANALTDPSARALLKYLVSCALPATSHLDVTIAGTTYGYDGQLGLAPEWGLAGGSCGAACQGWVSGCVLARLNYLGVSVPLSIRGATPALASTLAEQQAYPTREAAYYGNVLSSPQLRYACLSPGASADTRVCGPSLTGCVVTVVGSCADACEPARADGSFPTCRDHVRGAGGAFPSGTLAFPGSVTVFLP